MRRVQQERPKSVLTANICSGWQSVCQSRIAAAFAGWAAGCMSMPQIALTFILITKGFGTWLLQVLL